MGWLGLFTTLNAGCGSSADEKSQATDVGTEDVVANDWDLFEFDGGHDLTIPDSGALSACTPLSMARAGLPDASFASPYGVIVIDDLVVVTNANLDPSFTPGVGWLSVVDATTLEVKNRIELPQTNPQFVTHDGNVVYVSMSGPSVYDLETGLFFGTGKSGVAMIHKNNLTAANRMDGNIEFAVPEPGSLSGFPGSLITLPNTNHLFVGSGTGPQVYVIDTVTCTFASNPTTPWLATPEDGFNHLIYVGRSPDNHLLVTDFNSGTLQWWDSTTGTIIGEPVSTKVDAEESFTGPSFPEPYENYVVLLNAVSQSVVRISPTEGTQWIADVGSYPNRLSVLDDAAYVTVASPFESGNPDYVARIDLKTGAIDPEFATLDPQTNPMSVAWHQPTNRLFVSGNSSNTVLVLDGNTGAIQKVLGP
ncbi:MAG: WD40 repeat domain-containing protein [Myxococcales bacterium]|nr:WD40 repeat domain-containing protein [Myxococcales bacterium]